MFQFQENGVYVNVRNEINTAKVIFNRRKSRIYQTRFTKIKCKI